MEEIRARSGVLIRQVSLHSNLLVPKRNRHGVQTLKTSHVVCPDNDVFRGSKISIFLKLALFFLEISLPLNFAR